MTLLSETIRNTVAGFLDVDAIGNEGWSSPDDGARKLTTLLLQRDTLGGAIEGCFTAGQVVGMNVERSRTNAAEAEAHDRMKAAFARVKDVVARTAPPPTVYDPDILVSALHYISTYARITLDISVACAHDDVLAEIHRAAEEALRSSDQALAFTLDAVGCRTAAPLEPRRSRAVLPEPLPALGPERSAG